MWKWIKSLFTPKKQPVVIQQVVKKEIIKEPCWKHEKFKKGCPLCKNLNNGR